MRFSDAIREGSKLGPQHIGAHLHRPSGGTCVWGAAFRAVGIEADHEVLADHSYSVTDWLMHAKRLWPETVSEREVCPVCGTDRAFGAFVIEHLNDSHQWTREFIADWYEQNFEQPSDESLISAMVEEAKKHAAEPELVEA